MHSDGRISRFAALLLACATLGCADFKRGEYWDVDEVGETAGSGDGTYGFEADVFPVLDAGCERCHAAGNSAANTGFLLVTDDVDASLASTLSFVDLDSPEASRLLAKMAGDGHGGGVIFDDDSSQYDLTLAWIEQGAPP